MRDKIVVGHFWEKQNEYTIGWTGSGGTKVCKRCLNTLEFEQDSADAPMICKVMYDKFGKRIPKKRWDVCSADNKEVKK